MEKCICSGFCKWNVILVHRLIHRAQSLQPGMVSQELCVLSETGYKGSRTTTEQQDMRGAQSDSPVLGLNEEWFKSKTLLQLISSCNKTNQAGPHMYKTS